MDGEHGCCHAIPTVTRSPLPGRSRFSSLIRAIATQSGWGAVHSSLRATICTLPASRSYFQCFSACFFAAWQRHAAGSRWLSPGRGAAGGGALGEQIQPAKAE